MPSRAHSAIALPSAPGCLQALNTILRGGLAWSSDPKSALCPACLLTCCLRPLLHRPPICCRVPPEAYDFLLGKLRGGHGESSQSGGWEWHDWYWNFRISRTWNRQQRESSASPPPRSKAAGVSSSAPNLREQLAGLRQRAAIRATKARNAATGSMSTVDTCGTMEEEEEEVEAEGRPQHSAPAHSHVHSQAHATVHAQTHAHVGAQAQVQVHVHAPEHALPQQHHSLHHQQQQQPKAHELHTHHHVDLNLDLEGVHEHLAEHLVDASQQHQVQAQQPSGCCRSPPPPPPQRPSPFAAAALRRCCLTACAPPRAAPWPPSPLWLPRA